MVFLATNWFIYMHINELIPYTYIPTCSPHFQSGPLATLVPRVIKCKLSGPVESFILVDPSESLLSAFLSVLVGFFSVGPMVCLLESFPKQN